MLVKLYEQQTFMKTTVNNLFNTKYFTMQYKKQMLVILPFLTVIVLIQCTKSIDENYEQGITGNSLTTDQSLVADHSLVSQGKQAFRFDAFGDEDFWSGLLHLDKAIAGAGNGGFGTG